MSVSHVLCLSGSSPGCVFLLCCGGVLVLGCGCFGPCPFLPRFSCFGAPSSPLWCPSVGFGCLRVSRFVPVVPWIGSSISFSSFSRVSSGSSLLHPWGSLSFLPCSLFLSSPFAFLPPSSASGLARVSVHGFSPSPGGSPALPRLGVSSLAWLLGCFLSCPLPFLCGRGPFRSVSV